MTPDEMINDLRTILEDWEYEPGKISVRKIIGREGREKIQTRVDLGLLQLEPEGRPDGLRPHGFESLLDHQEHRLAEHRQRGADDTDFALTPDECRALRHEAYIYYQRFLSLFVLEEYDAVERDTAHNLRLMDLCRQFAADTSDRGALEPQRAYVMMMHTRAVALQALDRNQAEQALQLVSAGRTRIAAVLTEQAGEPPAPTRSELRLLHELAGEILDQLPEDAPAKLQQRLQEAVADEDYELAAALRDQLAGRVPAAAPTPPTAGGD